MRSAALLSLIARAAPLPDVLLAAKTPTRLGLAVSASLTWLAAVLRSLLLYRTTDTFRPGQDFRPWRKPASRSLSTCTPATDEAIMTSPVSLPAFLARSHMR